MRTYISERSVFSPACVIAVCVSAGVHVAALVGWLILALLPYFSVPVLIEAYGDSDREGFPDIEAVTLAPGSYRKGPEHTPGGDGQPQIKEPEPVVEPERAAPAEARVGPPDPVEEPMKPPAAVVARPAALPDPQPPPPPPVSASSAPSGQQPSVTKAESTGSKLPGAPGGSQLPVGTPSSGGTVGTRNGVREARGTRPPVYPRVAHEAGIEGTVVIWLRVAANGAVLEARLHKSSGYAILDDAALLWARKQKFIPARVGNTSVEAVATKPVHFYLY